MKRTVWKFVLSPGVLEVASVHGDYAIRHVGCDPATGAPAVWIENSPDAADKADLSFLAYGTGHEITGNGDFVGTAVCGPFVWHVYGWGIAK